MKIYVLGASGMLGKYVAKFLTTKNLEIICVNRDVLDASQMTQEKLKAILYSRLNMREGDVVINCMGTIKPRVDELGDLNAILVNSAFPRMLANVVGEIGGQLIHPTTDCVYTGNKGSYDENDKYDVSDVYGMSKAIGEPHNCTVIRTSIIGEEVGQGRSLVEWVKSSAGKTVNGFTNHYWNGITCLEFAKVCYKIIDTGWFWTGTKHVHSNTLNKLQLVETISRVYDLGITVTPMETPKSCDRSLATINTDNLTGLNIPTLEEQIKEMKQFNDKLYSA